MFLSLHRSSKQNLDVNESFLWLKWLWHQQITNKLNKWINLTWIPSNPPSTTTLKPVEEGLGGGGTVGPVNYGTTDSWRSVSQGTSPYVLSSPYTKKEYLQRERTNVLKSGTSVTSTSFVVHGTHWHTRTRRTYSQDHVPQRDPPVPPPLSPVLCPKPLPTPTQKLGPTPVTTTSWNTTTVRWIRE